MLKKLKAFTLAEALIVITIIGVVAAVAFPVLKKNYEIKAFHSAMKKNYYVLKTALDKYRTENFAPIKGTDSGLSSKLKPYINIYKSCGGAGGADDGKNPCPSRNGYYYYNDKSLGYFPNLYGSFILNDGTLMMFGTSDEDRYNSQRKYISVDVNGFDSKPNKFGYDVYVFQLNADGEFLPMGAKGTDYVGSEYCSENSTNAKNGMSCAYKVLMEER